MLKYILLSILFLLHWFVILLTSTYIWWGKPEYDKYFLFVCLLIFFHWFAFGECIISKYEKKLIYDEETIARKPFLNPSSQFYQESGIFTIFVSILIAVMVVANLAFVMKRMKFNIIIILIIVIVDLSYNMYFRYKEYEYYKNMKNN